MKKAKCCLSNSAYRYNIKSKNYNVTQVIYDSLILLMERYGESPEKIKKYKDMPLNIFETYIFLLPLHASWEKRNGYFTKFFSIGDDDISDLTAMSLTTVLNKDLP